MKLPFEIPTKVDDNIKYDNGYLENFFYDLVSGEVITRHMRMKSLVRNFCNNHSACMLYMPKFKSEDTWQITNYAYENINANISWFKDEFSITGDAYPITYSDRTLRSGEKAKAMGFKVNLDTHMIPQFLEDKVKSIIVAERYPNNLEKFGVLLLVGNNFGIYDMPDYTKNKEKTNDIWKSLK